MNKSILTTTVGSCPIPDWLAALPSDETLKVSLNDITKKWIQFQNILELVIIPVTK